ncbi:hypothetical protein S7335_2636 [Synechococcus sp. PCC 7335]|uniref:glycosyltransferase n=1 Tax=Synechococcus sp. (strain ATCC 29403 / PCC 7335) TaxID=91464 RepID=UPI00017EC3D4|nr:glycosyltransferase [Synechococcus sp. PCC 7335]EDX84937.1 hypothetical protein S7335_2636 [Synechococcus sp. PCC 7335]
MLANFNFPNRGVAEAFAKAQIVLYQASPHFQHYFYSLQKHVSFDTSPQAEVLASPWTPIATLARTAQSLSELAPRRHYRVDVLFCGIWLWTRRQEDKLVVRLLQNLLEQGASVLCLLHKGTSDRIKQQLQSVVEPVALDRLHFLDPAGRLGRLDARFELGTSRHRAHADFNHAQQLLAPHGIQIQASALPEFEWAAARLIEWEAWAPFIEFETALVRCHWLPLCSAVAHTALARQKKAVTLQQGVIGHSLDVPIIAHQYLCFGSSSKRMSSEMDSAFAEATGRSPVCEDYVPVGSLFDPILDLSDNFSRRTVLVLDQSTRWANHLYGLEEQTAALIELVTLLCEASALHKVIIRPHPASTDSRQWQQLAARFPKRCEISPTNQSLADDFGRAAIAVSLFSGASVTAAASGLPSFFLKTANGYYTRDLACCNDQFLDVESLRRTIEQLCTDKETYRSWQRRCRQNASAYYDKNQVCQFEPELMRKILAKAG